MKKKKKKENDFANERREIEIEDEEQTKIMPIPFYDNRKAICTNCTSKGKQISRFITLAKI